MATAYFCFFEAPRSFTFFGKTTDADALRWLLFCIRPPCLDFDLDLDRLTAFFVVVVSFSPSTSIAEHCEQFARVCVDLMVSLAFCLLWLFDTGVLVGFCVGSWGTVLSWWSLFSV